MLTHFWVVALIPMAPCFPVAPCWSLDTEFGHLEGAQSGAAAPLHWKKPVEVVGASDQDPSGALSRFSRHVHLLADPTVDREHAGEIISHLALEHL